MCFRSYSKDQVQPKKIPLGSDLEKVDPVVEAPPNLPATTPSVETEQWIGSPAYDDLKTNVTKKIMSFSDLEFTAPDKQGRSERFVMHDQVKEYLDKYSEPCLELFNFNTSVEEVSLISTDPPRYRLLLRQTRETEDGKKEDHWWTEDFDAICVCTGQFNVPFIPEVEGLAKFWEANPEKCMHAKYFKNNKPFADKVVLVVGCGVSGNDIALRGSKNAKKLYQSRRNPSIWENIPDNKKPEGVIYKPEFVKVLDDGRAEFSDGSTTDEPVDFYVFATGYQHDYKCLRKNFPGLISDGKVNDLYLSTFSKKYPNMAFVAAERMGSWGSFRAYEYQACAIDGVFSGRTSLPSREEMDKVDEEIEGFLKDMKTKPFQSMLIVRKLAIEYGKLSGGFSSENDKTENEGGIHKPPKWTHNHDVELLESSLDYLIECTYAGVRPDDEKMKKVYEMLSVPTFSPSDDDVYDN